MTTVPSSKLVPSSRTSYRVCPLCEATCGLELTLSDGAISRVRGDRDDVFSKGFICPKGAAFGHLDNDPDRLRRPMVRQDDRWREVSWDEAFEVVAQRLGEVVATHGRQAVGIYLGNPNVHTLAGGLYAGGLARALASRTSSRPRRSTRCPSTCRRGCCSATHWPFRCQIWTAPTSC